MQEHQRFYLGPRAPRPLAPRACGPGSHATGATYGMAMLLIFMQFWFHIGYINVGLLIAANSTVI